MPDLVHNLKIRTWFVALATLLLAGPGLFAQDTESRATTDALTEAFSKAYDSFGSNFASNDSLLGKPGSPNQEFSASRLSTKPEEALVPPPKIPVQLTRRTNFSQSLPPTVPRLERQEPKPLSDTAPQEAPQAAPQETPSQLQDLESLTPRSLPDNAVPTQEPLSMWWHALVIEPIDDRSTIQVTPELLLHLALQNSPRILATSKQPLIRESAIGEALAEFDPEIFLKTQFDDRVDPVGNQLTTGTGDPFLQEHIWYGDSGLRKKTFNGGEIEAKQRLGFQNSNSRFFDPQNQGTATLSLNFTQPLLRGRGRAYNRSQIVIAQLSTTASWDQFASELQDELTEVVEAYWTLYYNRAALIQKQYNVERGQIVLTKLEGRSSLDSLPSQIARARSAVQLRRTELANARRDVRNAETRIRRLIGSMENFRATAPEMIPMETPTLFNLEQELGVVIEQSIQMRPEIKQALQRAKIAAVQQNISQHELLPELNLIFNTYVSALRGETGVLDAWSDQFTASTPGYTVGLEFNVPYTRRAARARNYRQQLVLEQVRHELDQTMNEVVAETQIAWRQVDSAYQTTIAAAEAIKAARADLLQNEVRWESFALVEGDFAEGQTPTTLLDQLLAAQQRLALSEVTFSKSLLDFKKAQIELKRATGELLSHREISPATGYMPSPAPFNADQPRLLRGGKSTDLPYGQ